MIFGQWVLSVLLVFQYSLLIAAVAITAESKEMLTQKKLAKFTNYKKDFMLFGANTKSSALDKSHESKVFRSRTFLKPSAQDCIVDCSDHYDAICVINPASNVTRTFKSKCDALKYVCLTREDLQYHNAGVCLKNENFQNELEKLNQKVLTCTKVFNPVCATYADEKTTFINECLMHAENIRTKKDWKIYSNGICTEVDANAASKSLENTESAIHRRHVRGIEHDIADTADSKTPEQIFRMSLINYDTQHTKNAAKPKHMPFEDDDESFLESLGGAHEVIHEYIQPNLPTTNFDLQHIKKQDQFQMLPPNYGTELNVYRVPYDEEETFQQPQAQQGMPPTNYNPQLNADHISPYGNLEMLLPSQDQKPSAIYHPEFNANPVLMFDKQGLSQQHQPQQQMSSINYDPQHNANAALPYTKQQQQELYQMLPINYNPEIDANPILNHPNQQQEQHQMPSIDYDPKHHFDSLVPNVKPEILSQLPIEISSTKYDQPFDTNPILPYKTKEKFKQQLKKTATKYGSHLDVDPALLFDNQEIFNQQSEKPLFRYNNKQTYHQRHEKSPDIYIPFQNTFAEPEIISSISDCKLGNSPVCCTFENRHRSFKNICELNMHNDFSGEDWQISYEGPCNKCDFKCTKKFEPICVSRNGIQYTITNECLLNLAICKDNRGFWKIIKRGKCPGSETTTIEDKYESRNYGFPYISNYKSGKNTLLSIEDSFSTLAPELEATTIIATPATTVAAYSKTLNREDSESADISSEINLMPAPDVNRVIESTTATLPTETTHTT